MSLGTHRFQRGRLSSLRLQKRKGCLPGLHTLEAMRTHVYNPPRDSIQPKESAS